MSLPTTRRTTKNGVLQPPLNLPPENTQVALREVKPPTEVYVPDDRDLRLLMDRAVDEDDWVAIFNTAKTMALAGGQVGVKAMEFLAKYRFGLPAQMVNQTVQKAKPIEMVEIVTGNSVEKIENKPVDDEVPF